MIAWLRGVLAALALAALAADGRSESFPDHAERVVAVDWGLAETVLALGVPPVGLAESEGYTEWVAKPALPESVADIGLRSTPNLEFIAALEPDFILSTPQFAAIEPVLETVAPVLDLATYTTDYAPYRNAVANTRKLGEVLGRSREAEQLVTETAERIRRLAGELAGETTREVLILTFHDDRHVWVFGEGSLYHDVLVRAGLENAWKGEPNAWGITNLSVDRLAGLGDVAVLIVEPLPVSLRRKLQGKDNGSLIGQMALFQEGRYRILPPVWAFGGLPSAGRFADALFEVADFLKAPNAG